jgi:hypothetical protein
VGWGEIWNEIWDAMMSVERWVMDQLNAFGQWVIGNFQLVGGFIDDLFRGARWLGDHLWRGIKALRHLNFRKIWDKIHAGYERFNKALDWWKRHVQEPMDRMRRQIWGIYDTFFKPIVNFIDSLRTMIRPLALFNRKLAAKLDHRLMALEGKIMWPITTALHRINEISSYFTALITTAGRLARPVLLESIRRDALLVWEVLTNPRGALFEKLERPGTPSIESVQRDFREYLEHGTGPYAMYEAAARDAFRQGFEEAS